MYGAYIAAVCCGRYFKAGIADSDPDREKDILVAVKMYMEYGYCGYLLSGI